MAASIEIAVVLCSLEEIYRRFRGAYCIHRSDDGGSN
jgi:hypothetical protein